MPRQKTNYANSIIYKIVCNDLNITDCYVGHTTSFKDRKRLHKACCNNENNPHHNLKIYTIIRANGGWDNWEVIEIEKYPCETCNQAKTRERFWYEELNAKMNTRLPIILVDMKEYTKEYNKKYYKGHK